jgi:hypothetical protein
MSAKDSYLQGIFQGLGYYAAWMPNQSLSLGQVGRLNDREFEPLTSLQELKLPFVSTPGKTAFALDHSVKTNLRLAASVSTAGHRSQDRSEADGGLLISGEELPRRHHRQPPRFGARDLRLVHARGLEARVGGH